MDERLNRKKIEEKIINFLKQSTHGATGSEIAKYLGMNRITISKYLDVLRAEGLIDYKQVGRTKIWFLNEEIAFLELVRSEKEILKFIRRDDKNNLILGSELHVVLVPTELLVDLILELINRLPTKYSEVIKSIGKRLGKQYIYLYEMYSGAKISEMPEKSIENVIYQLSKFFLNKGWGKLSDIVYNHKKKELIVAVENSIIAETLKEVEDPAIEKLKGNPVCHLLLGFFIGIMEGIFNEGFDGKETKCIFKGDDICEFVIEKL